MKNRRFLGVQAGLFLAGLVSMPAFAGTGGVAISHGTYSLDGAGERIVYTGQSKLMPGEEFPYMICVDNDGSSCWIRLKVDYTGTDGLNQVDDNWLSIAEEEKWVKRGGYWYYTEPLAENASVDFCDKLCVPDLNNVRNGLPFKIISYAEAIQSANVTPDFSSENPFDGILIEDSTSAPAIDETVTEFTVRYEGGSETVVNADGLFENLDGIMPGDTITGTVTVNNQNGYRMGVTLKEVGEELDDLVKKALILTISQDGMDLYHGSLADNAIINGVSLGSFGARQTAELVFSLCLPEDVTNEAAFRDIKIALVFEASRISSGDGGASVTKDVPQVYETPVAIAEKGFSDGEWKCLDAEKGIWEYALKNGEKAKAGWHYMHNPFSGKEQKDGWFYFNESGIMQTGWIKTENGNWYYCNDVSDGDLGRMKTGWYLDSADGRYYYLDPVTGIMQTGWRLIDGLYYYFATQSDVPGQNWFWDTTVGKWIYNMLGYRTYGSMYQKEYTPDGYYVVDSGAWDGNEARADRIRR